VFSQNGGKSRRNILTGRLQFKRPIRPCYPEVSRSRRPVASGDGGPRVSAACLAACIWIRLGRHMPETPFRDPGRRRGGRDVVAGFGRARDVLSGGRGPPPGLRMRPRGARGSGDGGASASTGAPGDPGSGQQPAADANGTNGKGCQVAPGEGVEPIFLLGFLEFGAISLRWRARRSGPTPRVQGSRPVTSNAAPHRV
jgi:hypothetical protein